MSRDTHFAVRQLGWHQDPHGDRYTRRLPTAEVVATFDNFDDAEYHCRAREFAARRGENPFRFGGEAHYYQSSLDAMRLHDWFLDEGIEPPECQLRHSDWRDWWGAFSHTWTEYQIAHAWQGFDKVRFFDVAAEAPDALWMVIEIGFAEAGYNARDAEREGGRTTGLFRTEPAANAHRDRLNANRRAVTFDWRQFRYRLRLGYRGDDDSRELHEAIFFEVLRVPGQVPRQAAQGFMVQRRAFDPNGYVCHTQSGRDTGSRVPVRTFADRAGAEAHRDELLKLAHATMNPFQVYTPTMTGLGDEEFAAAVSRWSAPLPAPEIFRPALWREWWDLCQDEVTAEQRELAWALFADHPLFEVLPVEVA